MTGFSMPVHTLDEALPFLETLKLRGSEPADGATEARVREILDAVRNKGLEGLVAFTREFDAPGFGEKDFVVEGEELVRAWRDLDPADADVIREASANIREFHRVQVERSWFTTRPDGSVLGQMIRPVDRAGLYVPGGKGGSTPLVSSLLMNAIPAQEAGVVEIAVVSPPGADGKISPYILAAAHWLGIREVYAAGSAWAVAALAFGCGPLRPVDVIAGPGNIFVATAKRLLIGTVGIDMIAGPSEVCIVADGGADPAWVAADMLSQAEHDGLASAVCFCLERAMAERVSAELVRQCALLPRCEVAASSLCRYGAIITVTSPEEAMRAANALAPEHLELMVADPWQLLPLVRHAGAVFMGYHSAEPLGDYYAGPNHVLPTMGTARFSSALGPQVFSKKTSIINASPAFASSAAGPTARLARLEGLEAHARSALCRENPD